MNCMTENSLFYFASALIKLKKIFFFNNTASLFFSLFSEFNFENIKIENQICYINSSACIINIYGANHQVFLIF